MSDRSQKAKVPRYDRNSVERFLQDNFRDNQTMRWRLVNLIHGIREHEFQRGFRAGKKEVAK